MQTAGMHLPHLPPVFISLCLLWFASELWINRKRSMPGARRRDDGTLRLLHLAIPAGMALAVAAALLQAWPWPAPWAQRLSLAGQAAMAAGIALRLWSVRVLARHFTVDLAIRPGHRLVRHGPYRWLRHPSYSGLLLSLAGFALALGDALAPLLLVLPVVPALLRRIRAEEALLQDAFPQEWPDYARDTRRLLPWLW